MTPPCERFQSDQPENVLCAPDLHFPTPTKSLGLDLDCEKLSVQRKLFFTGPSPHDRGAPVNGEPGPLLRGEITTAGGTTPPRSASPPVDPQRRLGQRLRTAPVCVAGWREGKHAADTYKWIVKVAWRTREKPVLRRSRRCAAHRPAPQNKVVQGAGEDFQNKGALNTERGSPQRP